MPSMSGFRKGITSSLDWIRKLMDNSRKWLQMAEDAIHFVNMNVSQTLEKCKFITFYLHLGALSLEISIQKTFPLLVRVFVKVFLQKSQT